MSPAPTSSATRRFAAACLAWAVFAPGPSLAVVQVEAAPAVASVPTDGAPVATDPTSSRFLVVPYPIVDPTLGNGLLVGPVWMRGGPSSSAGPAKPQAYGVGALWTDGGTRGAAVFDHRAWKGGVWRTTALAGEVDLHFDYTGLRFDRDDGFGFAIAARGGSLSAERVLGRGPDTLFFSMFSATADVVPDQPPPLEVGADIGRATVTGITLGWARDTRDNVFLPSAGSALSARVTVIPEVLGASFDAQTVSLKWTHYRPLGQGVVGWRAKSDLGFGDPPFYLRPYVAFRGVAALSYAGEQVLSMEAEYRRPIRGNWHGLVFAAAGNVRSAFRGFEQSRTVSATGIGLRFKSEKLFGLTFGVDLAQGPEGTVGYVQIGNAWTN